MNRRDFPSEAAYYRAHREVFLLALELGVTPAEAEPVYRRRQHEARLAEIRARRRRERQPAARDPRPPKAVPTIHPPARPDFRAWDAPFMMRD